jgi:hypothetical protein
LAFDFERLKAFEDFPRRIGHGPGRFGLRFIFLGVPNSLSVGDGPRTFGFFVPPASDCRSSAAFPQLALPNFIG